MVAPNFDITKLSDGSIKMVFSGEWRLSQTPPSAEKIVQSLEIDSISPSAVTPSVIVVSVDNLGAWDSSLIAVLYSIVTQCAAKNIETDYSALPIGLKGLLKLATAVPRREDSPEAHKESWIARVGIATLGAFEATRSVAHFIGEISIAFARLLKGKTQLRRNDFLEILLQAGPSALSIVTLISVLVGLILAYIGAIQLQQFGAQIYVANLVGLAMTREMAGIMAGIILAGRTGAAFAAHLGTMQVNEEIDALLTFGISPVEFLVLPRMLAVILMIPLLCLYAMIAGIIGGIIVSVGALGISLPLYYDQTVNSIELTDVWVGVGKSIVFGALVALCGCYHGMRCGRSASAVGQATTAAVVSGIVCVVVADAVFAVLCDIVGI